MDSLTDLSLSLLMFTFLSNVNILRIKIHTNEKKKTRPAFLSAMSALDAAAVREKAVNHSPLT